MKHEPLKLNTPDREIPQRAPLVCSIQDAFGAWHSSHQQMTGSALPSSYQWILPSEHICEINDCDVRSELFPRMNMDERSIRLHPNLQFG